jgi:hypothetical protein
MGKTTLLVKLLSRFYINSFDKIYLICPTFKNDEVWSVLDEYTGKKKKIIVYTYFNAKLIEKLWKKADQTKLKHKNYQTLFVFDDCAGQPNFKVNSENHVINRMAATCNHSNVSVIGVVQRIINIAPAFRENAETLIMFTCQSDNEKKALYSQFGIGTFKEFSKMVDIVTAEPYHYLVVNRQGAGVANYYHNFKHINLNNYITN